MDPFFRNFSGWTEPIHSVLDRNFRKFWLHGSRPFISINMSIYMYLYDVVSVKSDACVASVSDRAILRKLEQGHKKWKIEGGRERETRMCFLISPPLPPSFLFFAIVQTDEFAQRRLVRSLVKILTHCKKSKSSCYQVPSSLQLYRPREVVLVDFRFLWRFIVFFARNPSLLS